MFAVLLALLAPVKAVADGKFFAPSTVIAPVRVPDQRALIHWSDGIERLVIESRFTGSGTNFAWVVPFPSPPVIEEASSGLFPTLESLFRPRIRHDVGRYYVGVLFLVGFVGVGIWLVRKGGFLVFAFVYATLAVLLLPALEGAKTRGTWSTRADRLVRVLDHLITAAFESVTISSHHPRALQDWLEANGFAMPAGCGPVISDYIKEGWVFVATKLRRDENGEVTGTVHPLSFSFKTARPVYPMRLTGVDNGPVEVELYVFGPNRVEARGFKVVACERPVYPELPGTTTDVWPRWNWRPDTVQIAHPLLRRWVGGAAVATKLAATLSPDDMRRDGWLRPVGFTHKESHLYTREGALTWALNWGVAVLTAGLLGAAVFARHRPRAGATCGIGLVLAAAGLSVAIYLALPKTEVRLVRGNPANITRMNLLSLQQALCDISPPTCGAVRAAALRLLRPSPSNAQEWAEWLKTPGWKDCENLMLGGSIREEDSPGNFTLREENGRVEYVTYDALGAEHVQSLR